MCRKQNFDSAVLTFTFSFSPPLFFTYFMPHFFFFAGHVVGFILVGKVCGKAFRILELYERKGRWVVEQDFLGNFQVSGTFFIAFFLWCP